ncbi:MAG: hypothetical protein GY725_11675 [bacterium]|nr:hypothetical protein [bacterium]
MPTSNNSDLFKVQPRRKTLNLILQPMVQLKLPVYLLVLTFAFAGTFWAHSYITYERLFEITLEHTDQPEYFERVISAQTENFKVVSATLAIAYVLLMLGISVLVTHRLVGPTVAFRRHIESLKNQDYSARIILRRADAFAEVARELNELAEVMEANQKGGPDPV